MLVDVGSSSAFLWIGLEPICWKFPGNEGVNLYIGWDDWNNHTATLIHIGDLGDLENLGISGIFDSVHD